MGADTMRVPMSTAAGESLERMAFDLYHQTCSQALLTYDRAMKHRRPQDWEGPQQVYEPAEFAALTTYCGVMQLILDAEPGG